MPKHFLEITLLVLAFMAVLWAAQFASKKIAGMQFGRQTGKAMRLIEAMYVSPGRMLQIIQVGGRYFLIAVSKDSISFLTELNAEDTKGLENTEPASSQLFDQVLTKFKEKAGHKDEK
ncbi:MAG: flagellar biosynthetic protein FliO [Eubacteriales bacterium]|nr:flagellar biosynthetic protein FliO [Eubacteriales bacterium]